MMCPGRERRNGRCVRRRKVEGEGVECEHHRGAG